MHARPWIIAAMLVLSVGKARAQHGGAPAPNRTPPAEAAQFNFLVGQWELTVKPAATTFAQKIHGTPKLTGIWKAWRALDGWGVEDEMRITDASGNPMMLSQAVRLYDPATRKWKSSTIDAYRGLISTSLAEWRKPEMITTSQGTDQEGKSYLSRARYTDISPTGFVFIQQRSTDNGKTWNDNLTIEAKRVAATAAR
jgi:hypothetical protein